MDQLLSCRGIAWHVRPDWPIASARTFCHQLTALLAGRLAQPIKIGKLKSVFRIPAHKSPFSADLILKKRNHFSLKGQWKHLAQGSRLGKEFCNYLEAERRGVAVPRVIAIGKKRRFGLLRESYLLMDFIESGRPLTEIWKNQTSVGESQVDPQLIRNLAHFVAQLMQKGVLHKDFSANNILVRGDLKQREFYLIDLDPCQMENEPSVEDRQICLSQLALHLIQLSPRSVVSVVRFILEILRQMKFSRIERKKWFLAVKEKTQSRYWTRNLPKLDKRLPAAGESMTKEERARRWIHRTIPIRIDFARPEGYVGAEMFVPKDRRTRWGFLREVAQAVRAAHWHGIRVHRVALPNLILRPDPSQGAQIFFLNPDEFEEKGREISLEEKREDLLYCWKVTKKGMTRWRRTDRLRFLKWYLGPWCTRQVQLRPLWQKLAARS